MLVPSRVHLTFKKNIHEISRFVTFNHHFSPDIFFHQTCKLDPRSNCPEQWWEWLWCHALHAILGVLVYQTNGGKLAAIVIDGGCCKLSPAVGREHPKAEFQTLPVDGCCNKLVPPNCLLLIYRACVVWNWKTKYEYLDTGVNRTSSSAFYYGKDVSTLLLRWVQVP